MAAVVNAVEVITKLLPSSSQIDLKCESSNEIVVKYCTQNRENIFPKNTWGSQRKKDMDLCQ